MRKYTGYLRYTADNSGRKGQGVFVELLVQFSPWNFSATVTDSEARTKRKIQNRRFNFQSRDSPQDLLARDKWRSFWFDRFSGAVYLNFPRAIDVPRELSIHLICSWGPAFVVVEFRLTDTYYQLACRPPRGASCWHRCAFQEIDEFDSRPTHEPASGSGSPPEEAPAEEQAPITEETPVLASPSLKGGSE